MWARASLGMEKGSPGTGWEALGGLEREKDGESREARESLSYLCAHLMPLMSLQQAQPSVSPPLSGRKTRILHRPYRNEE